MSTLKPDLLVTSEDLFAQIANVSTTVPYTLQVPPLGARAVTGDGREFRLAQAGATALVIGTMQQSAAPQANLIDVTAVAAAAGATSTTLTISTGTAIAAGALSGGYFMTYGTTANGGGQIFQIATNNAVSSSGTSITIQLADPVVTAITVSATVNILFPQFQNVIQVPTGITGTIAGLAVTALTASYYGWLQVKGVANALIQGTPAVNLGLVCSTTTAGALGVEAATTAQLAQNLKTGVDGRYGPVVLLVS